MKNSNCKFSTFFNLYPYKIRCVDFRWLRHSFKKYFVVLLPFTIFKETALSDYFIQSGFYIKPEERSIDNKAVNRGSVLRTAWYFRSLYFLTSDDRFCKSKPFRVITLIPLSDKVKRYRQNIFLKFLRPVALHKNGDFFAVPCDACDG